MRLSKQSLESPAILMFENIESGVTLYVDANVFIYNFTGQSDECRRLINRCEYRDLSGVTGIHVLLEVAHRLMMLEAVAKNLVSSGNVPSKLRSRPELIRQLTESSSWVYMIQNSNITVLESGLPTLESSLHWRQRYGLLVNDSVSAALMDEHDINTIATNDRDFERIEGLSVHTPGDL